MDHVTSTDDSVGNNLIVPPMDAQPESTRNDLPSENLCSVRTAEQDQFSSDDSNKLMEMFQSQLQQTVNLVDLMPATQKNEALASLYGLLSQRSQYPNQRVTDSSVLPLNQEEIQNKPHSLQSDPEQGTSHTNNTHANILMQSNHSKQALNNESDSLQTDISSVRAEGECDIQVTDGNENHHMDSGQVLQSLCNTNASSGIVLKRNEHTFSSCGSHLPPKKRGRGRPRRLSVDSVDTGVSSSGVGHTNDSSDNEKSDVRIDGSITSTHLRRSGRDRKLPIKITQSHELKLPGSKKLLDLSDYTIVTDAEQATMVKRGRGRPRKVHSAAECHDKKVQLQQVNTHNDDIKGRVVQPPVDNAPSESVIMVIEDVLQPQNKSIKLDNTVNLNKRPLNPALKPTCSDSLLACQPVQAMITTTQTSSQITKSFHPPVKPVKLAMQPVNHTMQSACVPEKHVNLAPASHENIHQNNVRKPAYSILKSVDKSTKSSSGSLINMGVQKTKPHVNKISLDLRPVGIVEFTEACIAQNISPKPSSRPATNNFHGSEIIIKTEVHSANPDVSDEAEKVDSISDQSMGQSISDNAKTAINDSTNNILVEKETDKSCVVEKNGLIKACDIKVEMYSEDFEQYIVRENDAYRCKICDKKSTYKANMKVHIRMHSGYKPFKCKVCYKGFSASNNLWRHIKETHNKQRPISCASCGEGFFTQASLNRHNRIKHGSGNVPKPKAKCDICKKTFKCNSSLKAHAVVHTHEVLYHCETCGKSFTFLNNLRRHLKIHRDYRPHACEMCGKRFIEPKCLRLHVKKVHEGCNVAPTGDPKYKCEFCDKPFHMKSWLAMHLLSHTGVKPHVCNLCDKRFSLKANLKRHLDLHTGVNQHACTECPKQFKAKRTLEHHMMSHRDERPHKCEVCKKGYTNKSALKEHMHSHEKKHKFPCNICGLTFVRSSHLEAHLQRHKGTPHLECEHCSSKFYRKCDLNRHLVRHSSVRPFTCQICAKGFTRKHYLSQHMKNHHSLDPKHDQLNKILMQGAPSQNIVKPSFTLVSGNNSIMKRQSDEYVDLATLLKLSGNPDQQIMNVVSTESYVPNQNSVLTESVPKTMFLQNTVSVGGVYSGANTVVYEAPDALQQATNVIFQSEDPQHESALQYLTSDQSLPDNNTIHSSLTTLVDVASKEHQRETMMSQGAAAKGQVVMTFDGSSQIIMVTGSEEDTSFLTRKDLQSLNMIHLKEGDEQTVDQNVVISSDDHTANIDTSNILTAQNDQTQFVLPDAQQPSMETVPMANDGGDLVSMETEDVVMEMVTTAGQSISDISATLPEESLVFENYQGVDEHQDIKTEHTFVSMEQSGENTGQRYQDIILPSGERLRLLVNSQSRGTDLGKPITEGQIMTGLEEIIQVSEVDQESHHGKEVLQDVEIVKDFVHDEGNMSHFEVNSGVSQVLQNFDVPVSDTTDHSQDIHNPMQNESFISGSELGIEKDGQYLIILKS